MKSVVPLSHESILELHEAALSARLAANRAGLLVGLPQEFTAGLPEVGTPGEQILTDLDALNAAGRLRDGTVPLLTWLRNAVALTGALAESAVFERILEQVASASTKPHDADRPVRADQPDLCDPRHGPTRLYVTSELWDMTMSLQVDLHAPAGLVVDRIIEARRLPRRLSHEGRIGIRFDYMLLVSDRTLTRAETLSAQGVSAGDVLWLLTKAVTFAAAGAAEGGMQNAAFRGGGGALRDETVRRLLRDIFRRAGLIGGGS